MLKITIEMIKSWFYHQTDLFIDLFHDRRIFRSCLIILAIFGLLYIVGSFVPPGFDWIHYFSIGKIHPIWTPWMSAIGRVFNWPSLVAITILAVGLRSFKYNSSPYPIFFAIFSLPTLWVIFMGNLEGIVILGLLILPWGVPLVLMKPQIGAFALLAKRSSIVAGFIWFVISLFIWGMWPLNFLEVLDPAWKVEWVQDISLFPWGVIIALPLIWFSRQDEDLLMAAGSFATPHLFPYHFIILVPSLARMKWSWMLATWLVSWTPLLANWLGPTAWHFGNLMSVFFWLGIYFSKKKTAPTLAVVEEHLQAAEISVH